MICLPIKEAVKFHMKHFFLFVFLISAAIPLLSGENATSSHKKIYLYSDWGSAYANFRDTGTSPLRYHGTGMMAATGFREYAFRYDWGIGGRIEYAMEIAGENYLLHYFQAGMDLFYLYRLPWKYLPDWDIRSGLRFSSQFAGTLNSDYFNAAFNLDLFNRFHWSVRIARDFTRPAINKKILFIPVSRPLRHYAASLTLDLPLLLLNMRPDFAYVIDGSDPLSGILSRHIFIGGFHLRFRAALSRELASGNRIGFAYVWEMFSSGKRDYYRLETASHSLQCRLYFRLK